MVSQYLTYAELLEQPLGVEWRKIPPEQPNTPSAVSTAENYRQVNNLIQRASGLADLHCNQVLGATLEEQLTDGYTCGIDNQGYLWVHTNFWPVISVQSLQFSYPTVGGTTWQVISTLSDIAVEGQLRDNLMYPGFFYRRGQGSLRVQYSYLNGYPNTQLSGTVASGSSTLPVLDATGMVAGKSLTVYDGGNTEAVVVSQSWVPVQGAANVALSSPTQFTHTPVPLPVTAPAIPYDISVSGIPPEVKQAVGLICKFLVEFRGATALAAVVGGARRASTKGLGIEGTLPPAACEILDKFARVV